MEGSTGWGKARQGVIDVDWYWPKDDHRRRQTDAGCGVETTRQGSTGWGKARQGMIDVDW
jgi:hypothetical protein